MASSGDSDGTVRLTDPRAIRALAHPARLTIIDALYAGEGELTATQCAVLTGLTASAASYHLRALERWGLVVRADASGDGRERPWRAAGRSVQVEPGGSDAGSLADAALIDTVLERDRAAVHDFLAGLTREPAEWQDAPTASTSTVWMTAAEVAEAVAAWREQIEAVRGRGDPASRPEGARRVRISLLAVPIRPA